MAASRKKVLVEIQRFSPEKDKPFYQSFEIRFYDELTVLAALNTIKSEQDGSLTYRYSCQMGICGSCGAVVNGKPVLMCQTFVKNISSPIKVEPLKNFPIIKDLVVDIDDPFEKMRMVMPYIPQMEKSEFKDGEYKQTPKQRKAFANTSQCIKCMLCYSACPVYGLNKDFIGPAAGALADRYNTDSRDKSRSERTDKVIGEKGVWKCSFVGECSAACPKRVDPALALQKLKLMGVLRLGKKLISKSKKKP